LLIIGIEDHDSHAGAVCGTQLAGLADRIDQIARDKVRPSLTIRSHPIENPDTPGVGCLLVHLPPSPHAPHMVDYTYYGRATARTSDWLTSRCAPSLPTVTAPAARFSTSYAR
jgi:hypothetical protein